MPRHSHSTAARSRSVFEPDLSAINSSQARTEHRRTAANTPYPPERYPVIARCPGPSASWKAQFRRARGYDSHECNEDPEFSPYGLPLPRHVSHGFENPEPELHQHHQHSGADLSGPTQRGRLYHRPSSYDAADRELEFDQRAPFGLYNPPQYDSAGDDSCFDDAHGSHRNNESPFEPQSLASFFGLKFGPPGPDSQSQDRENRDTNRDPSRRSRSRGRSSMGLPLGSFPDHTDLEYFQHHERDGMGPPLGSYPDYADLEPRHDYERDDMGPPLVKYPDYANFVPHKNHDSRRAGVRRVGRHLSRHRFADDSEADELEDNLSEAFIHRSRLAKPRGYHSDSDVESIDSDTEEEYFEHIRDFNLVDDAIADRYTGRLRAPTAGEKSHRRYLVSLSKDFDREHLRAEEARAELWLLKRQHTQIRQSNIENYPTPERVARQVRDMYSPGIHLAAADFSTGLLKESPRGRRDDQKSDSESITPQPQDTNPQVRHQAAAHPTATNHNPSSHRKHNKTSRTRRASDHPARPQKPHPNSNTAVPKDQAPPSYDSVPPAQATNSVSPDPANHGPRSPLPTDATETTTRNTAKENPRSHGENLLLQNLMRGTVLESIEQVQGQLKRQISLIEYSSPPVVRTPLVNDVHMAPAELGGNTRSESSDGGVATPVTSSDDDDDDRLKNLVVYS